MERAKALALGTAVGLIVSGWAQAADLPVKAKAIEYVKVCSLYGAGFWYIPGTDTCIRLGGYLRVDTTINGGVLGQPAFNSDIGQGNRVSDDFSTLSRLALTIDTRTITDYGVVRTFAQGNFQFQTLGGFGSNNPAVVSQSLPVGAAELLDTPGGGYVAVEQVFIQFAGFTFGKSTSAYSTPWLAYPGNISVFLMGGQDNETGVSNIQYTANFGNGVSASIGLDDPVVWDRTAIYNLALPLNATLNSGNAYAGVHAPDVVGRFRIDQAWGLFQISGAAHEVTASYNTLNTIGPPAGAVGLPGAAPTALSELSGHPDTKWGGAAMIGLNIKNIPTGPGDDIKFDASFAEGATKYIVSTAVTSPSFAMFGSAKHAGSYESVGFGATTDGVYLPVAAGGDGSLHLTESFGIRGGFNHNWDPYWSSSLYGSYLGVRYDSGAKAGICANFGMVARAVSANYSCNPDFNVSQLGVLTNWTPVRNLTFSAEFQWLHLDQKFTGSAVLQQAAPKPTARYDFGNQDTYFLELRAQRNF